MKNIVILSVIAAMALAGCSRVQNLRNGTGWGKPKVQFEGKTYRAKLSSSRADRAGFTIAVSEPGKGLEGAREAGRYEATRYCIKHYGNSDVNWTSGPDAPDGSLIIEDGKLLLRGRCAI